MLPLPPRVGRAACRVVAAVTVVRHPDPDAPLRQLFCYMVTDPAVGADAACQDHIVYIVFRRPVPDHADKGLRQPPLHAGGEVRCSRFFNCRNRP